MLKVAKDKSDVGPEYLDEYAPFLKDILTNERAMRGIASEWLDGLCAEPEWIDPWKEKARVGPIATFFQKPDRLMVGRLAAEVYAHAIRLLRDRQRKRYRASSSDAEVIARSPEASFRALKQAHGVLVDACWALTKAGGSPTDRDLVDTAITALRAKRNLRGKTAAGETAREVSFALLLTAWEALADYPEVRLTKSREGVGKRGKRKYSSPEERLSGAYLQRRATAFQAARDALERSTKKRLTFRVQPNADPPLSRRSLAASMAAEALQQGWGAIVSPSYLERHFQKAQQEEISFNLTLSSHQNP